MNYNKYILKKIKDNEYGYLSISVDYTRLEEYLPEIENDLKKKGFKGKVIFDLLTNNGINDRFYYAIFDGEKFLLNSISFINSLNTGIKKVSSEFYLSNFNLIQQTYFSKQSKFLIKKELEKAVKC